MIRPVFFFWVLLLIRVTHALLTHQFHLDGDISLPWVMANDWSHSLQTRFFWGQNYLGTQETWFLAKLGHSIFGQDGMIPLWLDILLGQLLYVIGVTFLYSALCRALPEVWKQKTHFVLSLLLFGFAPPAFQKYSFGIGHGYSSVSLAVGIAFFVHVRIQNAIHEKNSRHIRGDVTFFLLGGVLGLSISICRLNAVPVAALLIANFPAWYYLLRHHSKLVFLLGLGILAGLIPEFSQGLSASSPTHLTLFPLSEKLTSLRIALSENGVSLGLLPYSWFEGEHALWFRGHAELPDFLLRILKSVSMAVTLILLFLNRKLWRDPRFRFFLALVIANLLVICLTHPGVDQYGGRRYAFPASFAFTYFILSSMKRPLSRILIFLKMTGLFIYLFFSFTFHSPLASIRNVLTKGGFDEKRDCLVGFGGDLSPMMALNGFLPRVWDTGWRFSGNYSRSINQTGLKESCRSVFLMETGAGSLGALQPYCKNLVAQWSSISQVEKWDVLKSNLKRPGVQISKCERVSDH